MRYKIGDLSLMLQKREATPSARLLRPNIRVIALLALVLTIAAVLAGIYLDNHHGRWLSTHPISANLFAGLFGLPAAFLIVNIAAERAVRWTEMSRWKALRLQEAQNLMYMWRETRNIFRIRYSLKVWKSGAATIADIENALAYFREIILRISADHEAETDLNLLRKHFEILDEARDRFRNTYYIQLDETFRRRAVTTLLPRLESQRADPNTVHLVREAIDSIESLADSVSVFDARWEDYDAIRDICTRKDSPSDLEVQKLGKIWAYSEAHQAAIEAAEKVFSAMENLARGLSDSLPLAWDPKEPPS